MYVKVTAGARDDGGPTGNFVCEVTPPIYFDHISARLESDAEYRTVKSGGGHKIKHLVNPSQAIDFDKLLGASIQFAHVLEFTANHEVDYEEGDRRLAFRYVWWHGEHGLTAVLTTRNIFIVGENGKTIDRV